SDGPVGPTRYGFAWRDVRPGVLGAADADPAVGVLVLRGRGPAFSTGGDLREFGSAPSAFVARQVRWQRDVWGRLLRLRAITLAAVHGLAVGGGMEMALLCDLCLAADDARFALPETGRGMIPGVGGTQTLPRRVGVGRALDLTLSGGWLDARAAEALGLVVGVVPRRRLEAATLALARKLARIPSEAAGAARRCVRAAHDL